MNIDTQPMLNSSIPLPGQIQKNNRAEIYAICLVLVNIEIAANIYFVH